MTDKLIATAVHITRRRRGEPRPVRCTGTPRAALPAIYVVSLARTQRIATSAGTFSVHHIAPELFEGFESRADGTKLATPEKAIFDVAYLSGGRSRLFAHLPELELPARFRRSRLRAWTRHITAARRRSMVETRIQRILELAAAPESAPADGEPGSAS